MILKGNSTAVTSATTLGNATKFRVFATNADTLTIAAATITFNGASDVTDADDEIASTSHPFRTGQEVTYSDGGGTVITGLVSGQRYFVISEDANTIKLAATELDAVKLAFDGTAAGIAIDITSGVGAAHTLTTISGFTGSIDLAAKCEYAPNAP